MKLLGRPRQKRLPQTSLNLLRPTWIDNIGYAQNDDVMNCDDNGGDENDDGDYDLEEV